MRQGGARVRLLVEDGAGPTTHGRPAELTPVADHLDARVEQSFTAFLGGIEVIDVC